MKKIILMILSIVSVSCLTQKNLKTNASKAVYQIGTVQIKKVDRNQLEIALQNSGKKMFYMGFPNNPTIYYTSPDYEVIAEVLNVNTVLSYSFSKRYKEMRGITVDAGNTILSSDSISNFKNWVYALEFRNNATNSDKIGFSVESNKADILIMTDKNHRSTAVGLMDAFTKELLNVKLNLKPNSKSNSK